MIDTKIELLKTLIDAYKSSNKRSVILSNDSRTGNESYSHRGLKFNDYVTKINLTFHTVKRFLREPQLKISLDIRFDRISYNGVSYSFGEDCDESYEVYKLELYNLLDSSYKNELFDNEREKDKKIIDGLSTLIKEEVKRDNKISDLLHEDIK